MPLKEYSYSVLIVSSSEQFHTSLNALLPRKTYSPVDIVSSVSHARRKLSEKPYDLVIINAPLPDEFGRKFAIDACSDKKTVAMLLVKSDLYDEIFANVFEYGVLTLRKPISVPVMRQALDWMCTISRRLGKLEKKALTLEEKMSEIRIVNRAKWALIEACKMTEADAHKYIEKQAMNRCVTRREIAEGILQTYH